MALLEIKKAGDPVLKEICTPVERVDKKMKKLLDDMAETMYNADGVGLAAPQVGVKLRAVVIDVQDDLTGIKLQDSDDVPALPNGGLLEDVACHNITFLPVYEPAGNVC